MSEESLQRYASRAFHAVSSTDSISVALKSLQDLFREAIKESSEEKDLVINRLVDSVDDPEKLLRALNTLR